MRTGVQTLVVLPLPSCPPNTQAVEVVEAQEGFAWPDQGHLSQGQPELRLEREDGGKGTWQQVNGVQRHWRQIRKDTGLDWVTPPTFRETVAT